MEPKGNRIYLAYQLRLWRTRSGEAAFWGVSLKSARTSENKGFAGLDKLFDFLRQQTSAPAGSDGDEPQNGMTQSGTPGQSPPLNEQSPTG